MYHTKHINVPYLKPANQHPLVSDISVALNDMPKNDLSYTPWAKSTLKPSCSFVMAYDDNHVFLKFFVTEDNVLIRFNNPNDLVYQDSCVEMFIAFNNERAYYNFEFNAIGTCYLGYGASKEGRETADAGIVQKIKSAMLLHNHQDKFKWELCVEIPCNAFYHHSDIDLASTTCQANFYKCGDDLPVPHYLCWNNIESATPNFHLRDFFGNITFDRQSIAI